MSISNICLTYLKKRIAQIKIFGGGGGTILPSEIKELQDYGITKIYHPDDGRSMGLQGMINDLVEQCDIAFRRKARTVYQRSRAKNMYLR